MQQNTGEGNFRRTANRAAAIFNLLNDETGYAKKKMALAEEQMRSTNQELQEKHGEAWKLNEEWAKEFNGGTTDLEFVEWCKRKKQNEPSTPE